MLKSQSTKIFLVSIFLLLQTPTFSWGVSRPSSVLERPNILLVVVDDMGFTDLGSFGGEISTPNLDALAMAGIRFTNFQTAPTCSPTRSMLLTGVDNHKAGLGNMHEELSPNQQGQPGYEGHLNDRVVTVASLLRDAGYRTYMAGKWHLGLSDKTSPYKRGFDRTFTMLSGGASHFDDMKPAYAPTPDVKAPYRENGQRLNKLPEDFDYSSRYYAGRIIEYIEESKAAGQPFFAYLAYTAPHWPLQVPDDVLEKYKSRYDDGYDALHVKRFTNQNALGLLPKSASPTPRPERLRAWHQLSDEQKTVEIRRMEIYAAMIDEIDVNTGRVIDYLKANGLFENTIVIFMSDNGAEGHDIDSTFPTKVFPKIRKVIDESSDFSYRNMGRPDSYVFAGEGWAWASSPALKHYKGATYEGGTRVLAFAYYPRVFRSGVIENELISIKDVVPSLLELAGVVHPGRRYKGRDIEPMTGMSMVPLLQSDKLPMAAKDRVLGVELMGKRAIRKGEWKLVYMPEPYGIGDWQLYNLRQDLVETKDLSARYPRKVKELKALWEEYSEENNLILPDWVSGY